MRNRFQARDGYEVEVVGETINDDVVATSTVISKKILKIKRKSVPWPQPRPEHVPIPARAFALSSTPPSE